MMMTNKRQRRSISGGIGTTLIGDTKMLTTSGVASTEMLDDLSADALEYYIHYIEHDRYVF